jgi:thymidylate synthase (FAD)
MDAEQIDLLDHGYLKLIETWGSDQRIIEAARMSTDKGFLGWGPRCKRCKRPLGGDSGRITCPNEDCEDAGVEPGDEKLLEYLWTNKHATPFEMAGLTIEVQAPIFVFREWHRHRVPFGYNEMSARYTPLPDLSYVPTVERCMLNSVTNKQAGTIAGADALTAEIATELMQEEREFNVAAERFYQKKLKAGIPKELARTHVGVSRYSRMRATGNLRGWLAFLTLRQAPNAQWEIRQYANAVGGLIAVAFPRTWALFARDRDV